MTPNTTFITDTVANAFILRVAFKMVNSPQVRVLNPTAGASNIQPHASTAISASEANHEIGSASNRQIIEPNAAKMAIHERSRLMRSSISAFNSRRCWVSDSLFICSTFCEMPRMPAMSMPQFVVECISSRVSL